MAEEYSIQTGVKRTFQAADYGVFAATLGLSAIIGLYYAIKDRKKNNTEEYLLAGRKMNPIPVAMSLLASFISAIALLGTPSEVYVHSTMVMWLSVGFIITGLGAGYIYIPVFYKLGVTTVFQYLEMRFNRATRMIATVIYLIQMMLYMAIVLYAPSLAINAVTGMSLWGSIVAVSLVCTFYTSLGGMKAVLWTDTLQTVIIFAGMLTILIKGASVVGSFSKAWEIADKGGRILFDELNPDPRIRHSVWNVVIGGGIRWLSTFGVNQAQVQRAISVKSVTRSRVALLLSMPGMALVFIISGFVGVVMYAFYAECYPVGYKLITKPDQLLPLFTMDILGNYHGLPGLILSTIISGTLSSMSSGLNAVAAVVLEDFIKPCCSENISPRRATIFSKVIVIIAGLLCLLLSFLVSKIDTLILQLVMTLFGILSGPLLGLFTLGMLCPSANSWGAIIGYVTSLVFSLWVGLGRIINKVSIAYNPGFSTKGCNWNITGSAAALVTTTTASDLTTLGTSSTLAPVSTTISTLGSNSTLSPVVTSSMFDKYEGIQRLYMLSYQWYSVTAVLIAVGVGLVLSYITGPPDPSTLNPKLICPWFDIFCPWLPERTRKRLRFGVRHEEVSEDDEKIKRAINDECYREGKDGTFKKLSDISFIQGKDNLVFDGTDVDWKVKKTDM